MRKDYTATLTNLEGLHANPLTYFVYVLNAFHETTFSIALGERCVDAKSLLGVLSLGVCQGHTIKLTADGPDEEVTKSLSAIKSLVESKFASATFATIETSLP